MIFWAHFICLFAGLAVLYGVAERNILTATCLYLPRGLWLFPAILVAPLLLPLNRRLLIFHLVSVAAAAVLLFGLPGRGSNTIPKPTTSTTTPDSLVVMSYNRGQHQNQSLQPFKNTIEPDILVFQEAGRRAAKFKEAETYSEFTHVIGVAEFVVLSRYPFVEEPESIKLKAGELETTLGRVSIDVSGRQITLYAVHLPTPRAVLGQNIRGGALYGVLGFPGSPFRDRAISQTNYWDTRTELVKTLLERVATETSPTLLVGDFNAPSGGYVHRLLTEACLDGHEEAGSGKGFTFPGTTRNPLSLGGPWMRLDYILASRQPGGLEFSHFVTEAKRPSQHRAIAARVVFTNPSP